MATLCKTIHHCAPKSSDQIRLKRNVSLDCITKIFLKPPLMKIGLWVITFQLKMPSSLSFPFQTWQNVKYVSSYQTKSAFMCWQQRIVAVLVFSGEAYPYWLEEVQIWQKVSLCLIKPLSWRLTNDLLGQLWNFLVCNCHKLVQGCAIAQVFQMNTKAFDEDLVTEIYTYKSISIIFYGHVPQTEDLNAFCFHLCEITKKCSTWSL